MIYLALADGRIFGFSADRFRILSKASDEQLKEVQLGSPYKSMQVIYDTPHNLDHQLR
jgi:hypothetical protein